MGKNIIKNYKKIKQNKRREFIENNLENILVSKKLVTLKSDIDTKIVLEKVSNTSLTYYIVWVLSKNMGLITLRQKMLKPKINLLKKIKNILIKTLTKLSPTKKNFLI